MTGSKRNNKFLLSTFYVLGNELSIGIPIEELDHVPLVLPSLIGRHTINNYNYFIN